MIENLWEYFRMVSFMVVIISALISFLFGKPSRLVFLGDIIFAMAAFTALLVVVSYKVDRGAVNNIIITPGAIIWAVFHFINLLKFNGRNHKTAKADGGTPIVVGGSGPGEESRIEGTIQGTITQVPNPTGV